MFPSAVDGVIGATMSSLRDFIQEPAEYSVANGS